MSHSDRVICHVFEKVPEEPSPRTKRDRSELPRRARGSSCEDSVSSLEGYFLQMRSIPKQSSAAARPMTPKVTIHSMPVGQYTSPPTVLAVEV